MSEASKRERQSHDQQLVADTLRKKVHSGVSDAVSPSLIWTDVIGGIGLIHGWVAFGSPYGTPAYALDGINKLLHFRGGLNGQSATNEVAFILPVELRPSALRQVTVFNANYFGVRPNGECFSFAGSLYAMLDGVAVSL